MTGLRRAWIVACVETTRTASWARPDVTDPATPATNEMSSTNTQRAAMRRHLRSQTLCEAANVVLLPLIVVWVMSSNGYEPGACTALGLFAVALFLVEGTLFWWLKWRAIRHLPVPTASRYAGLHDRVVRLNLVVLAATAIGIAWLATATPPARTADVWCGAGAWLFAVAEHVNYFHWQLMHQKGADFRWLARHRRLKRGVAFRLRHGGCAEG